jgi:hypothetical protein
MQTEVRRARIRRVVRVVVLILLALLAAYGVWLGLGAWTAQQTGWQPIPGLSPLPTPWGAGTPRPTPTPGWWDSPLAAPTLEVPVWEGQTPGP